MGYLGFIPNQTQNILKNYKICSRFWLKYPSSGSWQGRLGVPRKTWVKQTQKVKHSEWVAYNPKGDIFGFFEEWQLGFVKIVSSMGTHSLHFQGLQPMFWGLKTFIILWYLSPKDTITWIFQEGISNFCYTPGFTLERRWLVIENIAQMDSWIMNPQLFGGKNCKHLSGSCVIICSRSLMRRDCGTWCFPWIHTWRWWLRKVARGERMISSCATHRTGALP